MEKKVKGSWLIHHTQKLQGVSTHVGYDNVFLAGKAGILLSAISASSNESKLSRERVKTLAQAANINATFEMPKLLDVLKERELIDLSKNEIAVLGVTTSAALQHTSDVFDTLSPSNSEVAALELSETVSIKPILTKTASEELADKHKLATGEVGQLLYDSELYGFVDIENIGRGESLIFNGNLFRREESKKIQAVLSSLSSEEARKLTVLAEEIKSSACLPIERAEQILGKPLFEKVTAIGMYDVNVVSNSTGSFGFLTAPAAFSKFGSSMVDDAFDLAKAFVSSITYGMTQSSYARGQIQMVDALLTALVRGESVGPVKAIAEDYRILELKGVVEVKTGTKNGRTGPMLKLLKKEVGELALQAIRQGDVSEHSLPSLPSAVVTKYHGPEQNRERIRKAQVTLSPKATNDMLNVLRTGGGF